MSVLNNHHTDIKFTHEAEEDGTIPFLDVHIQRKPDNKLRLKVYRKKTCSNIYIHWNAFAPVNWKIGTLEGMIRRAYTICSENNDLQAGLSLLSKTFHTIPFKNHQKEYEQDESEDDNEHNHSGR